MKSCATCTYWQPTEMEVVSASRQPHQQDTRAQTEMLRATHALCVWPSANGHAKDVMDGAPPWMVQRVGGGTLTDENDGADCPAYFEK